MLMCRSLRHEISPLCQYRNIGLIEVDFGGHGLALGKRSAEFHYGLRFTTQDGLRIFYTVLSTKTGHVTEEAHELIEIAKGSFDDLPADNDGIETNEHIRGDLIRNEISPEPKPGMWRQQRVPATRVQMPSMMNLIPLELQPDWSIKANGLIKMKADIPFGPRMFDLVCTYFSSMLHSRCVAN